MRVAAVQAAPVAYDLHQSLHKLRSLAFAARENGAELVVFPEAFLSAYPRHLAFQVGSRSEQSREWFGRYVRSSVKVPPGAEGTSWLATQGEHPPGTDYYAFQQLAQIARKYTLYLSVGVVEAANVGSTLWCTNLLFGPTGMLLAKHRKIQPTAAERVVWAQGEATNPAPGVKRSLDGNPSRGAAGGGGGVGADNLPVVPTPIGRIGALICWENYMPLARYLLYKKGVELYLAPTADGRATWLPTMQHIAMEGRCFVITANQYHAASDFPADYPASGGGRAEAAAAGAGAGQGAGEGAGQGGQGGGGEGGGGGGGGGGERGGGGGGGRNSAPAAGVAGPAAGGKEIWSRGGSAIVGPLGDVLAGPLWDKEGILYADVDIGVIDGAKLDFDPIGHYAREGLLLGLLNDAGMQ